MKDNLKSTHLPYDTFSKHVPYIVLKDSDSIKKEITTNNNKKHLGKTPLGKWNYKPADYTGFDDQKYGTAFQCNYISELGLFFVVIDIDAHNPNTDIAVDKIESAIPEEFKNTRIINTPNGGKHYYYLSKKPPTLNVTNINVDYKTVFANDVEKDNTGGYVSKKSGGYVVASYRWNYAGTEKEQYTLDTTSSSDILIVENTDAIVHSIYDNLFNSGDISAEVYNSFKNVKTDKHAVSIDDDIQVKLKKLDSASKLKGIQKDAVFYEQNGLRYDSDRVILLNKHNGTQLITQQTAKIISQTHGKHNDVLLALEGGLDHYGFTEDERRTILFDALELADDYNSGHVAQIESSIKKDKNKGHKKGFQHLEKHYPKLKKPINMIYNIKHIFWQTHSPIEYQLMEIPYIEFVNKLNKYIEELDFENKNKKEAKINVRMSLDSYLKMMGVNVHERYKLFKKTSSILGIKDTYKFIKNELSCTNEPKSEHALLTKNGLNLGFAQHSVYRKLKYEEKIILKNLAYSLDIQLSLIRYGRYPPKIQPLINLVERPHNLEPYKRRQLANNFLKQHNNLKKTKEDNFIFDDVETNSYIQVDANKLGNYLSKKYPILKLGIEGTELEKILNISGTFDELHYEYYLFNNGVLNLHKRAFTKTTDFTEYFTIKKMDCDFKIENIIIDPINTEPACLVDRILREIFIPNYKKDAKDQFIGYYMDFLQRLGSAFNTRIKEKKFPCYYGLGDNGKDIIIEILKMAFGDRCLLVTMEILQDEKADLSNYDVVIIDELDKKTFKDAIAFIKRITGGEEEGTAKRKHYSHEVFRPKNPSAFFLFTNEIPDVPLSDTAFYRREDALELKNIFTDKPNLNKNNEFQADSSLKDKIKNAKENSLEWLINAGLKAYYDCFDDNGFFKGFKMAQTADETKMIVSNTDPLTKFLRESYVADEEKVATVTNSELRDNYENYCQRNNLSCDTSNLAITMGNAVKKVFGDVKKKASNATVYTLAPKNADELKTKIYIDSITKWWQVKEEIPEETYDNHKKVYDRIEELGKSSVNPTIEQLIEEFSAFDVNGIIENLIKADLIFKGGKLEN